ncbi:MAG: hypothetical protein CM1200mP10_06810 [Candidatus Neomarinimicrobiota bacterium]|nr:MAG: hypothetical protein CM1200mP10_06810 [Candidatus Neomarinimicrobiota bacterium]
MLVKLLIKNDNRISSPTSGMVEVNNLNISDHTLKISDPDWLFPELNPLYPEMTVFEYLEFIPGGFRKISGKKFRDALSRVVDKCGLQGVVHKHISSCSKGYKQRIGFGWINDS